MLWVTSGSPLSRGSRSARPRQARSRQTELSHRASAMASTIRKCEENHQDSPASLRDSGNISAGLDAILIRIRSFIIELVVLQRVRCTRSVVVVDVVTGS